MRYATDFFANEVRREAGSEQRAVQRRKLALVNLSSRHSQFPFNALADQRGRIGILGSFLQRGFDVAIGNAACAKLPRDSELTLLPRFRAKAYKLFRIAGVIDQVLAFQALDDAFQPIFVFAPPRQRLLHLRDGMGASHQDLDGGIVQLRFGFELTGLAKGGHGVRIEEEGAGRQRGMRDVVKRRADGGWSSFGACMRQPAANGALPRAPETVGRRPNIRGCAGARARFRPEFVLYDWSQLKMRHFQTQEGPAPAGFRSLVIFSRSARSQPFARPSPRERRRRRSGYPECAA